MVRGHGSVQYCLCLWPSWSTIWTYVTSAFPKSSGLPVCFFHSGERIWKAHFSGFEHAGLVWTEGLNGIQFFLILSIFKFTRVGGDGAFALRFSASHSKTQGKNVRTGTEEKRLVSFRKPPPSAFHIWHMWLIARSQEDRKNMEQWNESFVYA